ncbi:MAG: hypothetical protein ABSB70_19425 [Candidatus Velthaea sp.]|jgi:hypothetical protein
MNAVELLRAEASVARSETGSSRYSSNFLVLVQNLAFAKYVGIWGHDVSTDTWNFHPCSYSRSVPHNAEIWEASVGSLIDRFGVGYQDLADLYLDTNGGHYYRLDTRVAEGTFGLGTAVINRNVLGLTWGVDAGGTLAVNLLVKNIGFEKQVAIVYTTDGWLTLQNAFGSYLQSLAPVRLPHQPNAELWEIVAPVGAGESGQFAAFLTVAGTTYWDNNFGLNYSFSS